MASLNTDGSIKTHSNKTYRYHGRSIVDTKDQTPNVKSVTVSDVPSFARSSFGTKPDRDISWRETISLSSTKKITTPDQDALVERIDSKVSVSASEQPELELKAVRRRSYRNTGNRVAIRDSQDDSLVARQKTTGAFD